MATYNIGPCECCGEGGGTVDVCTCTITGLLVTIRDLISSSPGGPNHGNCGFWEFLYAADVNGDYLLNELGSDMFGDYVQLTIIEPGTYGGILVYEGYDQDDLDVLVLSILVYRIRLYYFCDGTTISVQWLAIYTHNFDEPGHVFASAGDGTDGTWEYSPAGLEELIEDCAGSTENLIMSEILLNCTSATPPTTASVAIP